MGLRQRINNWEISRKVNCSELGRNFENSDFARNIEFSYACIKDEIWGQSDNVIVDVLRSVIHFPFIFLGEYRSTKRIKRDHPELYERFLNNPDIVLNDC